MPTRWRKTFTRPMSGGKTAGKVKFWVKLMIPGEILRLWRAVWPPATNRQPTLRLFCLGTCRTTVARNWRIVRVLFPGPTPPDGPSFRQRSPPLFHPTPPNHPGLTGWANVYYVSRLSDSPPKRRVFGSEMCKITPCRYGEVTRTFSCVVGRNSIYPLAGIRLSEHHQWGRYSRLGKLEKSKDRHNNNQIRFMRGSVAHSHTPRSGQLRSLSGFSPNV